MSKGWKHIPFLITNFTREEWIKKSNWMELSICHLHRNSTFPNLLAGGGFKHDKCRTGRDYCWSGEGRGGFSLHILSKQIMASNSLDKCVIWKNCFSQTMNTSYDWERQYIGAEYNLPGHIWLGKWSHWAKPIFGSDLPRMQVRLRRNLGQTYTLFGSELPVIRVR